MYILRRKIQQVTNGVLIQPFNNEARRVQAVESCKLLDTPAEPRFDNIVQLAAERLDAPMAAFSLIDRERVWFKAEVGLGVPEVKREISICGRVATTNSSLILEDARNHDEFSDNPLVVGPPFVAFYAGVPVRTADEYTLGSLCVMDTKPRSFPWTDFEMLQYIARMLEEEIRSG